MLLLIKVKTSIVNMTKTLQRSCKLAGAAKHGELSAV